MSIVGSARANSTVLHAHRWQEARASLQRLLSAQEGVIRDDRQLREAVLTPMVGAM